MAEQLYGIYGGSGFGREVLPLARAQLDSRGIPRSRLVIVDDQIAEETINGHAVVTFSRFLELEAENRSIAIAISSGTTRAALAEQCAARGVQFWSIEAANRVIMDDVIMGPGSIIGPFVTLTSNIRIGGHFHANIYSYVAHDCVIGDFVTFAPAVRCNGNARIEDHAYLGTGAILKQGKPGKPLVIGRAAVVGMGAVVTRDVAPGTTVIGNPARPLARD